MALLIGGCDRQSGETAQPPGSAPTTGTPVAPFPPTAETKGVLDRSHKGARLPDFTFADPSGKTLRLASLQGRPMLINLWATWCAPCVVEMPTLNRLAAAQAGKLHVLTVSQDMAQPDKVAAFFTQRGLTKLEPWLDPDNDLAFHYGANTLPTTVFYDAQGREVWRYVGGREWTGAETQALLAEGLEP